MVRICKNIDFSQKKDPEYNLFTLKKLIPIEIGTFAL